MTLIGALAVVLAAVVGWRGLRRMRRGLRASASLELVRGIRALVTAAVFLAEELYETGVLVLILRASGEAGPARATP